MIVSLTLLVTIGALVGVPIVATILVTVASHREESAQSLRSGPPGAATAMARRLLGFYARPAHAYLSRPRSPGVRQPRPTRLVQTQTRTRTSRSSRRSLRVASPTWPNEKHELSVSR